MVSILSQKELKYINMTDVWGNYGANNVLYDYADYNNKLSIKQFVMQD